MLVTNSILDSTYSMPKYHLACLLTFWQKKLQALNFWFKWNKFCLTVSPHLPTLLYASLALVFSSWTPIASLTSMLTSFRSLAFALPGTKQDSLKVLPIDNTDLRCQPSTGSLCCLKIFFFTVVYFLTWSHDRYSEEVPAFLGRT